jgi:DNA/RNA-binding domain of Phe-tRNA-synthetase-like protein
MLIASEAWKTAYPGAAVGILELRDVVNPEQHAELDRRKGGLEDAIRARFADREALLRLPPIQAYRAYYKRYTKTYHVQLQVESIALKGKSIPHVAALVEAMFMAELKNLLLTAGHDLEAVQQPLTLDIAKGAERYVLLNGQEQVLKAGDMRMADARGVICSVLYGMDQRTRITRATRQVLFVVYAPPGIGAEAVQQHLRDIQSNVELVAPQAKVATLEVYTAG